MDDENAMKTKTCEEEYEPLTALMRSKHSKWQPLRDVDCLGEEIVNACDYGSSIVDRCHGDMYNNDGNDEDDASTYALLK